MLHVLFLLIFSLYAYLKILCFFELIYSFYAFFKLITVFKVLKKIPFAQAKGNLNASAK